eukprot:TRINITY_DN5109_c0_g1_i2.p1 TRINITY_DN5109_c0_g1~~TRINITY_DN5109_c0_g1_i2.p1  ORF type:complete len:333 (+),score=35.78 TRINITY_DN5109_c0_g1_i2:489-1487(+)
MSFLLRSFVRCLWRFLSRLNPASLIFFSFWNAESEVHLLSRDELKYVNSCFARQQTELVKALSPDEKKCIRLLKIWKSRFIWPVDTPKLPSYLLEIMAMDLFKKDPTTSGSLLRFLEAFFKVNVDQLDINVNDLRPLNLDSPTFVLDLVNPAHNVADRLHRHPELLRAFSNAMTHDKNAFLYGPKSIPTDKPAADPANRPAVTHQTVAGSSTAPSSSYSTAPLKPATIESTLELRKLWAARNIVALAPKKAGPRRKFEVSVCLKLEVEVDDVRSMTKTCSAQDATQMISDVEARRILEALFPAKEISTSALRSKNLNQLMFMRPKTKIPKWK